MMDTLPMDRRHEKCRYSRLCIFRYTKYLVTFVRVAVVHKIVDVIRILMKNVNEYIILKGRRKRENKSKRESATKFRSLCRASRPTNLKCIV